ncbi:TIGR02217 family protein [Rhodosalinus sp. 5P4]|uniref:phage distal tail protein, Rcc01695 family n=1 Tax=Rhodosalinus sp. 5P4 TaxID=3239196 RepID=UPI0035231342
MGFHEIRFPSNLSFGSVGGPERRTDVVTLANGFEERNTPWAQSRRRYDAGVGLRSLDDIETLVAFFEARRGRLHGFRWKDWADFKSSRPSRPVARDDQHLGAGDGATRAWQLVKTYRSGEGAYTRRIEKPVSGTVRVAVQGDALREGVDFEVDASTGLVTLERAPAAGMEITAGFEFDVPVRFDTDAIQTGVASFRAGEMPRVPVVEIRT